MSPSKKPQLMSAQTAAKKLGIYLSAAPQEFQDAPVSREALDDLTANPPAWLTELRQNGPHPRDVVAHKLGVSNSGLARGGVTDALTTAEISALLQDRPEWLVQERATQAAVHEENARVKAEKAYKRSQASG